MKNAIEDNLKSKSFFSSFQSDASRIRGGGVFPILGGVLLGVAIMMIFDPISGRRRRAFLLEKGIHLRKELLWQTSRQIRNIRNHVQGWAAEASHVIYQDQQVDDITLVERVRSEMGRKVRHPRSIEVAARDGLVTLRGLVLKDELDELLECVEDVRGVSKVVNQLETYKSSDKVSGMQGEGKPAFRT